MEELNNLSVPEGVTLKLHSMNPEPTSIVFFRDNNRGETPMLELKSNGDIFVKGRLVENDKEVVDAMREFLGYQGLIK
jgi:hypothetical protein